MVVTPGTVKLIRDSCHAVSVGVKLCVRVNKLDRPGRIIIALRVPGRKSFRPQLKAEAFIPG